MQLLSNLTLACENSRFQAFGISKLVYLLIVSRLFFVNFPLKMHYIHRLNIKHLPRSRFEENFSKSAG